MSGHAIAAAAPTSYTGVAKGLHWLIAALVLLQFVTKLMPAGAMSEDALDAWHLAIGPAILLVMLVRLVWRLTHTPPPPPADISPVLQIVSRVTHWAFYAILILLPIGGWISASGFGARPTVLGVVPLPMLIGKDKAAAETWGDIHGVFAWVLLALIGLHILGALYHLAVKKDGVMGRMLPGEPLPP